MKPPSINRRQLIKTAAATSLTAGIGATWFSITRDPIRLGLVGAGGRGRQLARTARWTRLHRRCGEMVAVCDVNRRRAEQVRDESCPWAALHEHYQEVLDRDDIEAVLVATPDHWHTAITLAALRAGKAVYCEKPLTLTVAEGKLLVAAVEHTRGVVQVGTQQRSDWRFRTACELVRNGRLGNLRRIEVTLPSSSLPTTSSGGPFTPSPVPNDLNWDLWLGQAPWAEFCKQRYDPFRWWFEYSGGFMTDWGAHHLDIVHRALGVEDSGPQRIDGRAELPDVPNGYNTPRRFTVDLTYPGGIPVRVRLSERENGILFEGDEGRIFVNRGRLTGGPVEQLARRPLSAEALRLDNDTKHWGTATYIHLLEFFDCIRTGKRPISDVASQHRTATACHLANLSMRLGRPIRWDPASERCPDDAAADALLERPQRAPYLVAPL
ncbi:MAG TPA: Gfo/Idh/MocA family oxidoreductase [Pirellulales bacterium]|nr:Gfo/Idh/MocA family oxidoreductase [Pirellulales bacterium]